MQDLTNFVNLFEIAMAQNFSLLPEEIVGEILSWLEVCEQFRTRLVCNGWRTIIKKSQKEIDIDHYAPCVSDETLSFFQKEFKNLNTLHLTYCWKVRSLRYNYEY